MSADAGFRVERLRVSYGGQRVLDDTSGFFRAGRMSAIVGPNGAGKSTLVKAMLGLIPIDRGSVTLFGDPVRRHRHRIAYVPQRASVDWSYPATVAEVIGMGRYPLGRLWRRTSSRDREWVREALQSVSLAGFEDRAIGALSGGQQQRVFLARAIAQEAAVVVLDEPFTAIDAVTESLLWRVLAEMAGAGKLVVVVHHDLAALRRHFHDVAILSGRMIACGSVESVLTGRNIAIAYRRPRHEAEAAGGLGPAVAQGPAVDSRFRRNDGNRSPIWSMSFPRKRETAQNNQSGEAPSKPSTVRQAAPAVAHGTSRMDSRFRGNGEKWRSFLFPSFPRKRESMQNSQVWELPARQESIKCDGLPDPAREAKAGALPRASQAEL